MKKILVVFGTRPEVVKLYPVIKALGKSAITVFTGQHEDLANQMMSDLKIQVDYSCKVMNSGQSLTQLIVKLHQALDIIYKQEKPDLVIVQGDTATALVGALEAYYHKIPIAHIEAGLRSSDIYSPHPEEGNRKIISQIATYHFAPTDDAQNNLIENGVSENIFVVGNTGIDTLLEVAATTISTPKCQVLVTLHRRESFGKPIRNVIQGIKGFLDDNPSWSAVIPVHPNPEAHDIFYSELGRNPQAKLLLPLAYTHMVKTMMESAFIITDSGGIQEEAISLNKPVLVARNVTDRPESIDIGASGLVGTESKDIRESANQLANNKNIYESMINKKNPYGDGHAAERIVEVLN